MHSLEAVELEEEEVERKLFQLETSRSPTAASIRTNCDDGSRNATSRPGQTKQEGEDKARLLVIGFPALRLLPSASYAPDNAMESGPAGFRPGPHFSPL